MSRSRTRSDFVVEKMDCPAEEGLVRLALAEHLRDHVRRQRPVRRRDRLRDHGVGVRDVGDLDPQRADYPAAGVTWAEAESFCRWLGKRLPSELEWEKAARGPGGLDLPYEDAPSRVRKLFNPFQDVPVNRWPELASPYRIEGMLGPVWEWTSAWFAPYPGNDDAALRSVPRDSFRVVRGGARSPSAPPSDKPLEVTFRERRRSDRRDPDLGFRCAASVATAPDWLATEPEPEKVRPLDEGTAEKAEAGRK